MPVLAWRNADGGVQPSTAPVAGGPEPPPIAQRVMTLMRARLFDRPSMPALTVISGVTISAPGWPTIRFLFIDAVWDGAAVSTACRKRSVTRSVPAGPSSRQIAAIDVASTRKPAMAGSGYALGVILLVPLPHHACPTGDERNLVLPGCFHRRILPPRRWDARTAHVETGVGRILITLVISFTGIIFSLPLGIVLALGRRSDLPIIRTLCIAFIEVWRGVPLITVLFFATYMLPFFLPGSWKIDGLLRVLIGVVLFAGAYMAEVVRGGLQAIPRGQFDGAMALGLGYWRMMGLVILPQALRLVIPGIVNSFISLFKDTSLVLIVSIFDLLGQLRAAFADPTWATPVTLFTGFAFTGMIYFLVSFGMSRYVLFMERHLKSVTRGW
jgi:general L-amino acid transport system permease protein